MSELKITLAAARVNAKKTQSDVASYMSVSKQTIVNWEKGKVKPRLSDLNMMCEYYNISPDFIFLP